MEHNEFYVRNKNAGYLGNSWVWCGLNNSGYTAYLQNAERFSKAEAQKLCAEDAEKYEMYPCAHIDARSHAIFDSQDAGRLGTDEESGWKYIIWMKAEGGPYATPMESPFATEYEAACFDAALCLGIPHSEAPESLTDALKHQNAAKGDSSQVKWSIYATFARHFDKAMQKFRAAQ